MTTVKRSKRVRDECPVCMECIGGEACSGTDGDRVLFPCGHFVCGSCNDSMLRRDDHRCPTCRNPRGGFTREMADAHAEQRVVQDMAEEGDPNAARLLAMRSALAGAAAPGGTAAGFRGFRVAGSVLPNDMAPMLQDLVEAVTQGIGRPRNRTVIFVGTNGNRVHVGREPPRRSERLRDRDPQTEDPQTEDPQTEDAQTEDAQDPQTQFGVPQPLRDLISALVSPVDLARFHEVRRRV